MSKIFSYKAKNAQGRYFDSQIEAEDEKEALEKLEAQGLWVITLMPAAPKTPSTEPTKEPALPSAVPVKTRIFQPLAVVLIIGCFVLLAGVLRFRGEERPSEKRVPFQIIQEEDYDSQGDYLRYHYHLTVERDINRSEILRAAQDARDKKKSENPRIQEMMFSFYYSGQKVQEQKPVAVLRWNWGKSNVWESSFHLDRGGSIHEKDIKVEEVSTQGKAADYKFIIPDEFTVSGAEKAAKYKMVGLQSKWRHLDEVRVELIYEGFDFPFMKCVLMPKSSAGLKPECKIIKIDFTKE